MSYDFMLDEMVWSFSRLTTFDNCKYEWYLTYIEKYPEKKSNIYGEFGSFCHMILEQYANGILTKDELLPYYVEYFDDFVTKTNWNIKAVDKLFSYGVAYFGNINFDPGKMDILGVEQEFEILIGDHSLKGFIDLLYREKDGIVICDHKSCEYPLTLKEIPKKGKEEKVESFKRQLYLYSMFVKKEYGEYPKYLEWNFFRNRKFWRIPFSIEDYKKSVEWATQQITNIYNTEDFEPNQSFFYCNNLCDYRDICEYR